MGHVIGEQVLAQDRRDVGGRAAGNLHPDGRPAQRADPVHVAARLVRDGGRGILDGPRGAERVVLVVAEQEVRAERVAPALEEREQVARAAVVARRRRDAVLAQPPLQRGEVVEQLLAVAAEEVAAAALLAGGGVRPELGGGRDFREGRPRAAVGLVRGGDGAVLAREPARPAAVLAAEAERLRVRVERAEPEVDARQLVVELDGGDGAAVLREERPRLLRDGAEPAARLLQEERVQVGDPRAERALVRAVRPLPA